MNPAEWFGQLHWRAPLWLLLALQPLVILALRRWLQHRCAQRFAAPALLPWVRVPPARRYGALRSYAHTLAWLLVALAAAGPRLPQLEPGQSLRAGVDWMLVVDVSRSMTATDIAPSRLKRVRIELLQHLPQLRGNRVGLAVFAGRAHLVAPPIRDMAALSRYLDLLQPQLLPTRGSRPDQGLALAADVLSAYADQARAVLLITDHAGDPLVTRTAAARLQAQGIRVFVLGMGSPGGSIEVPQANGSGRRAVPVPLDTEALRAIATAGGGAYATVAEDASDWQRLYERGIAPLALPRPDAPLATDIQWRELYPWLLAPALLLLTLTLFPRQGRAGVATGVLALSLSALYAPTGQAADAANAASAAYHRGQYQTARDLYAQVSGFDGRLGEGASAYRLNDYERAGREFAQAVLEARTDAQRAAALLNLGNAYFQLGDYRSAETTFADALRYRPAFEAAERNRLLARLVAEQVERRLPGNRPGAGQRLAETDRQDGPGPLTLGEPAPESRPASPRTAAGHDDAAWAELIARGLRHARVAAEGRGSEADLDWQTTQPSAAARAHAAQLAQEPVRLWRRLFELEEGYAAPLAERRNLPGEAPW